MLSRTGRLPHFGGPRAVDGGLDASRRAGQSIGIRFLLSDPLGLLGRQRCLQWKIGLRASEAIGAVRGSAREQRRRKKSVRPKLRGHLYALGAVRLLRSPFYLEDDPHPVKTRFPRGT